jgi:DNA-binding response OmpR family regulator
MASRILVVNDERAILELIEEILTGEGYEVHLDDHIDLNPAEIERIEPDLIILDYLFGSEAAGLQVLQRLKLNATTAQIPVILCTAATSLVQDAAAQMSAKGVEIVFKPFEIDDLLQAVRRMLGEGL